MKLSEVSAIWLVLPKPTNAVSSTVFINTTVSSSTIVKQKLVSCVAQYKTPSPSATDNFNMQK